jgi:hypothetical protein
MMGVKDAKMRFGSAYLFMELSIGESEYGNKEKEKDKVGGWRDDRQANEQLLDLYLEYPGNEIV